MNGTQESLKSESALNVNLLTGIERRCAKCKKVKPIEEFHRDRACKYGYRYQCKICGSEISKQWRTKHLEKSKETQKRYRVNNKEVVFERERKYRKEHHDLVIERTRRWRKKNPGRGKQWVKENLEKYKAIQRKHKTSLRGKLNRNISAGIWKSLNEGKANRHWEDLVGYTWGQLKLHLEKQFKEGMTWGNYGEWHIDHKIPIAVFNFKTPEDIDFKRCWSLKNLQPLWKVDNLRKHTKLDRHFQPSFAFCKR